MIFQYTLDEVLDGDKTETSRLCKEGDIICWRADAILSVSSNSGRVKWQVGKDYAVQEGCSEFAIARILITHIRRMDARKITPIDVRDEGFASRDDFLAVWCDMHDRLWYRKTLHSMPIHGGQVAPAGLKHFNALLEDRPAKHYMRYSLTFRLVQT